MLFFLRDWSLIIESGYKTVGVASEVLPLQKGVRGGAEEVSTLGGGGRGCKKALG